MVDDIRQRVNQWREAGWPGVTAVTLAMKMEELLRELVDTVGKRGQAGLRPEFDGDVLQGKRYVLVDDVTNLGGTLAELANYIQSKGGIVHGVFVLVNAGRSKSLSPDKQTLKTLEARYGHELI